MQMMARMLGLTAQGSKAERQYLLAPLLIVVTSVVFIFATLGHSQAAILASIDWTIPFQLLAEGATVIIAFFIFSTIWHTRDQATAWQINLGLGFLAIGCMDAMQLLVHHGVQGTLFGGEEQARLLAIIGRFVLVAIIGYGTLIPPMERVASQVIYRGVAIIALLMLVVQYVIILEKNGAWPLSTALLMSSTNFIIVQTVAAVLYAAMAFFYMYRHEALPLTAPRQVIVAALALCAVAELWQAFVPGAESMVSQLIRLVGYGIFYHAVFVMQVKRPYEDLRQRRDDQRVRMVALLNASKDGIAYYNWHQGTWVCNENFAEMFGWDEEVIHFDSTELFLKAMSLRIDDMDSLNTLLDKNSILERAQTVQKDNGEPLTRLVIGETDVRRVDVYMQLVMQGSSMAGCLMQFCDVTKQQNMERLRQEYFSSATHEIRTPLTSIDGYLELAADRDISVEEREQFLSQARASLERLHHLVTNILDLEKIQGTQQHMKMHWISVDELILPSCDSYAILASKKKLQFSCEIEPDLPPIYCDESQLAQAINNLLSNAIKYTLVGACGIKASREGERVRISIWDTGIGLSAEEQEHLFERFYRAENAVTRGTTGTGLGLSIVKAIIELQGGEIEIKSQSGRGSEFILYLPIKESGSESA
ncbi:sensor histidine kinase [Heliophilum fasciatum]|uniref:histidine kinase n=1 Tax=Heliophilum fasciatum TaxID=35700 RepID=A0A4R2RZM2_9FIRM|nr:ATP-binding protein [Heliophilum fasciatum]MCW2276633.1 signal transduction histidine kinase [Heliophilum fasciatum]TCP68984.1 signal transduction histidine kinase [Heliophilum fasciatum]